MATKTVGARAAYAAVRREAEKIKNDELATIPAMEPGDVVVQGDVYIVAVDRTIKTIGPWPSRQLALGTTQGSRHVAEGDCDALTPDEADAAEVLGRTIPATREHKQFFGPVLRARGPVTITHPEHGDRTLPAGEYLVTHQRAYADEVRRTQD